MRKSFLFLAFFLILLVSSVAERGVLVITDGKEEMVYPLGEHEITIEYIHSVERSEVVETLKVNSSGIYAIGMKWKDFGAGLPEDFQEWNGSWYEKRINIYLGKSLDYWFIPLNRANITVDGLPAFAPRSDTLIEFRVESCPLLLIKIGRC
ncbi:hypothetical protein TK0936 [Thermococcus kodakarensis KOD1]|uniref:DUF1850 domain-containing protein n=1 Tax=Thermococcus kodakarensis (strain ATCC BAA-918 / JCM 12380 / KOD1) TaxID=69014 RepID=Q5JI83_THEKO|nr:hypothetical protein TK0936 [Thermococcus kodakarensis KOD1]